MPFQLANGVVRNSAAHSQDLPRMNVKYPWRGTCDPRMPRVRGKLIVTIDNDKHHFYVRPDQSSTK
jgi:hypothetical protein